MLFTQLRISKVEIYSGIAWFPCSFSFFFYRSSLCKVRCVCFGNNSVRLSDV